jgi:CRISPR-associated exonuclease Cas4
MNEEVRAFQVTGTFVWYYSICKREVWLLSRQMTPDQEDPNIVIGKFIGEQAYSREKKEMVVGNSKIDTFRMEGDQLIISEVKKSSKFHESARLQLLFYLRELKRSGILAKGELRFPEERIKEEVILDEAAESHLEEVISDIKKIVSLEQPPVPSKISYCKTCAYAEFCWS